MAHSEEWAIGYVGGRKKGGNWGRGREPVVDFVEWTTGWSGKPKKGQKPRLLAIKKAF